MGSYHSTSRDSSYSTVRLSLSLGMFVKVVRVCLSSFSLQPPDLEIKKPQWIGVPSQNICFFLCLCIYFFSVSGITYDIINSPPAFGVELDDHGRQRPVGFLK